MVKPLIRKDYRGYIINDISERESEAEFIKEAVKLLGEDVALPGYLIIGETEVKGRVFHFLKKQPIYDLILTGDRGGTMLFPAWELEQFGEKVMRLEYSDHHSRGFPLENLIAEVSKLGERPRILIIDSDMGPQLATRDKLLFTVKRILEIKKEAAVDVVVGVASKIELKDLSDTLKYVACWIDERPMRLSELLETYLRNKDVKKLEGSEKRIITRLHKLQEHRRIMRMTPR